MKSELECELQFALTVSASAPGTKMTRTYCLLTTSSRSTCTQKYIHDVLYSNQSGFFGRLWCDVTSAVSRTGVPSSSPFLCSRSRAQTPSSWSPGRCLWSRGTAEPNRLRPPRWPGTGSPSRPRGSLPGDSRDIRHQDTARHWTTRASGEVTSVNEMSAVSRFKAVKFRTATNRIY